MTSKYFMDSFSSEEPITKETYGFVESVVNKFRTNLAKLLRAIIVASKAENIEEEFKIQQEFKKTILPDFKEEVFLEYTKNIFRINLNYVTDSAGQSYFDKLKTTPLKSEEL